VHQDVWYDRIVEVEHVTEQPFYVDNIIEKPIYVDHIIEKPIEHLVHHHYDVEVIEEVENHYTRIEEVKKEYEVIIEHEIEEVIEHPYDNIIENIVYVDNVIKKEVVHHNHIDIEVEKIVERNVYKDHIIEEEVLYETTVEHHYDNYIEVIKEVKCPVVIECPVEVMVERPIHVEKIVYKEIVKEKIIPITKEVVVEIDTVVDNTLKISYDSARVEYQLLHECNGRWKDQCEHLEREARSCGKVEDWSHKINALRRKCVELEIEISNIYSKKHTHRGSTREKHTTVIYTESAEAMELKNQINQLTSENRALNDKILFHGNRITYGTSNYSHSLEMDNGREVRKVRKSNKNAQNHGVQVLDSKVYESHVSNVHHHDSHTTNVRRHESQVVNTHHQD